MRDGGGKVEEIKFVFNRIILSAGWTFFNDLQRLTDTLIVIAMTAFQYYDVFG